MPERNDKSATHYKLVTNISMISLEKNGVRADMFCNALLIKRTFGLRGGPLPNAISTVLGFGINKKFPVLRYPLICDAEDCEINSQAETGRIVFAEGTIFHINVSNRHRRLSVQIYESEEMALNSIEPMVYTFWDHDARQYPLT